MPLLNSNPLLLRSLLCLECSPSLVHKSSTDRTSYTLTYLPSVLPRVLVFVSLVNLLNSLNKFSLCYSQTGATSPFLFLLLCIRPVNRPTKPNNLTFFSSTLLPFPLSITLFNLSLSQYLYSYRLIKFVRSDKFYQILSTRNEGDPLNR